MVVKMLLVLCAAILFVSTMVSARIPKNLPKEMPKEVAEMENHGNGETPQIPMHQIHGGDRSEFKNWHEKSEDDGSFVDNGYGRKYGYRSNHEGSISEGNNNDFSDIIPDVHN